MVFRNNLSYVLYQRSRSCFYKKPASKYLGYEGFEIVTPQLYYCGIKAAADTM